MKRLTQVVLIAILTVGMPLAGMAMSHGEHGDMKDDQDMHKEHEGMEHGKEMSHDMHKGHDMSGGDFAEVGKDTQNGVVATVMVKTYDDKTRATMANMGMEATHHVMVSFADAKTGKAVDSGQVALKVKSAAGETSKPVMLMQMGEGFGADVNIKDDGMYTFEVGTKLKDGEKRQFMIDFHNM
ncbi:MAG: hypothetical protein P8Y96_11980 [Desulfuromonadales bacterium]